jgi:hypothetical protein
MAPKSKKLAKPSKKAKEPQVPFHMPNLAEPVLTDICLKVPETENDFLEAADEFESSAGKWKAG